MENTFPKLITTSDRSPSTMAGKLETFICPDFLHYFPLRRFQNKENTGKTVPERWRQWFRFPFFSQKKKNRAFTKKPLRCVCRAEIRVNWPTWKFCTEYKVWLSWQCAEIFIPWKSADNFQFSPPAPVGSSGNCFSAGKLISTFAGAKLLSVPEWWSVNGQFKLFVFQLNQLRVVVVGGRVHWDRWDRYRERKRVREKVGHWMLDWDFTTVVSIGTLEQFQKLL